MKINSGLYITACRSKSDKLLATAMQLGAAGSRDPFSMMKEFHSAFGIDQEIQRRLQDGINSPALPPALALVMIGKPAVDPLIDYLAKPRDWIASEAAIWALGLIGDQSAIPCLKVYVRFLGFDRLSKAARKAIRSIKEREKSRTA